MSHNTMIGSEEIVKTILTATLSFSAILMGLFAFSINSYNVARNRTASEEELKKLRWMIRGVIIGLSYTSFINVFVLFVLHIPFKPYDHYIVIGFFVLLIIGIPVGVYIIARLMKVFST